MANSVDPDQTGIVWSVFAPVAQTLHVSPLWIFTVDMEIISSPIYVLGTERTHNLSDVIKVYTVFIKNMDLKKIITRCPINVNTVKFLNIQTPETLL